MYLEAEDEALSPTLHPLKLFDHARSQKRYLYACAPMVRYSKLAFRQVVHHYNTDLCWTPMILAKEFNRSSVARDSDFTTALPSFPSSQQQQQQPPTVVQFGANVPLELARASSLVAPYASGVDLNCGCPQSWACAETLGAALMEERGLVRDMLVETRARLRSDGWAVDLGRRGGNNQDDALEEATKASPKGRSVSVKIRVHADVRKTVDFIETVLGDNKGSQARNVDWLTIHPRTRRTPSSTPISVEKLALLTDMFGDRVPILVSGDVFTLRHLPYTSHLLAPQPTLTSRPDRGGDIDEVEDEQDSNTATPQLTATATSSSSATAGVDLSDAAQKAAALPNIPKLRGLMAARALLANPALFAGHETCPWEAVDVFMSSVARAPLPLKLAVHHITEMCGPGYGPDKRSLLSRKERAYLCELGNWVDVIDFLDEVRKEHGGIRRLDPL
ncbi:hypothetical protein Micbo1qcDRAFT_233140 [Microdochium bolleyi]|uniref:DUS-like FMN-binding domain-containing protein n=1 Tax=Microdochium bolleyi TaxID=196109 RepID=A0A136J3A5_9PEZI|nr:hypothetical protein Micbo1qcDRAFT_233140 [Microdochium bolleyi]